MTHWKLDKNIPISLIAAIFLSIFVQTFALGVWVTSIQNRVSNVETKQLASDGLIERVARIETKLDFLIDKRK